MGIGVTEQLKKKENPKNMMNGIFQDVNNFVRKEGKLGIYSFWAMALSLHAVYFTCCCISVALQQGKLQRTLTSGP